MSMSEPFMPAHEPHPSDDPRDVDLDRDVDVIDEPAADESSTDAAQPDTPSDFRTPHPGDRLTEARLHEDFGDS
ncbi:hypothetical protein [Microbacterium binotii]|uniref:hypothetical protein n=1 Tax=Microbacterium binotii TaxID=462710 RepID=UPI001F407735|nr:hypothetical protein [Microbacterium binotii]UIN31982.1 hypothetical protein LXM64_07285 [Microbacterium binotii]